MTPPNCEVVEEGCDRLQRLATPCLHRPMADPTRLTYEVAVWARQRPTAQCRVECRLTIRDASIQLTRLDPSIPLG
jgi:hypothetical protein